MTKRVFLWSTSRCVSTAFERSVMEIKNSKVFHHPFEQAYYFGPERQSGRYSHYSPDEKKTYQTIGKSLVKEYDGVELLFCKELAIFVKNHFGELLKGGFQDFQHTFLIRNPKKAVPSLYAASINKQLTGWDYFKPEDAGFKELLDMYRFIVANKEENPVVVDAGDLLEDPEGIMRAYCEGIGVTFDIEMLHWEPRHLPIVHAPENRGWHTNVINSTGFHRYGCSNSDINENEKTNEERLPEIVIQTIEDSMPYYEEMYKQRVTPKSATENK